MIETAKDAILFVLLLPLMALAFILSIPPAAIIAFSWWRGRR
jgi:hypothetical protein